MQADHFFAPLKNRPDDARRTVQGPMWLATKTGMSLSLPLWLSVQLLTCCCLDAEKTSWDTLSMRLWDGGRRTRCVLAMYRCEVRGSLVMLDRTFTGTTKTSRTMRSPVRPSCSASSRLKKMPCPLPCPCLSSSFPLSLMLTLVCVLTAATNQQSRLKKTKKRKLDAKQKKRRSSGSIRRSEGRERKSAGASEKRGITTTVTVTADGKGHLDIAMTERMSTDGGGTGQRHPDENIAGMKTETGSAIIIDDEVIANCTI